MLIPHTAYRSNNSNNAITGISVFLSLYIKIIALKRLYFDKGFRRRQCFSKSNKNIFSLTICLRVCVCGYCLFSKSSNRKFIASYLGFICARLQLKHLLRLFNHNFIDFKINKTRGIFLNL